MRVRALLIVSVAILLAPGVLHSMEQPPAPSPPRSTPAPMSEAPSHDTMVTRIYRVRYYPVDQLADIITRIAGRDVTMARDDRSNRLLVTAPADRLEQVGALIEALDVVSDHAPQAAQMMCRVYMLELPSEDQTLKPFSLTLESSAQLSAVQFLSTVEADNLQIRTFRQGDELAKSGHMVFEIQGRAASTDAIRRLLTEISPDALIQEFAWDEDVFSAAVPAQVTRLPAPLEEHVHTLLGEDVQTVGYWFGHLSLPGEVKAPIGPWMLSLNVEPEQANSLELVISVVRESQIVSIPKMEILSNTVRSQVGKPIIIGYNRDRCGIRTLGAMVIVPEIDTTRASRSESKAR